MRYDLIALVSAILTAVHDSIKSEGLRSVIYIALIIMVGIIVLGIDIYDFKHL